MFSDVKYDLVVIVSDLGSGGTQRVLSRVVSYWNTRKKKILVITLASEETDFFHLPESVDRYSLDGIKFSNNIVTALIANVRRITKLRKVLRTIRGKRVLSFLCTTNILSILATRGLNVSLVISERNDPSRQSLGIFWGTLRRMLYRYANVVTANSKKALSVMSQYVPEEKLKWVPNPIAERKDNGSVDFNCRTILAVGRLHHQKAYDVLLQAFAQFQKKYASWSLVVVGEGPLEKLLKAQAISLGIEKNVIWCGRVDDPFPYYHAADIFVMPSRYEGMPNALLEAMSCELPVIISNALSGPLEYVQHQVSGFVVSVGKVEALTKALTRLAADEKLRLRLGKTAKQSLMDHSFEGVMGVWNSILRLN